MAKIKTRMSGRERGFDVRPDRIDFRDRIYSPPLKSLPHEYPPPEHIEQFLPVYLSRGMILDQGSEGACTGFGLAAVINYTYWETYIFNQLEGHKPPKPEPVSPRMLYNNARLYDEWEGEDYEGSSCRGAMKGWHKHGVCSETLFPYDDGKFIPPKENWDKDAIERPLGAYYRVNSGSISDIQAAIYESHAVYVSCKVHQGWSIGRVANLTYSKIYQGNNEVNGGHAFALVGYNRIGFIVQNSWGLEWGYQGFGLLPYDDWIRNAYDAWVASMSAPIENSYMAIAKTPTAMVEQSKTKKQAFSITEATPINENWSKDQEYRHAIVSANNGRLLLRRLPEAADANDNLKMIFKRADEKITDYDFKHLVFYAHGGLVSEQQAMQHIRCLAPYYLANKIYPIFFVWRTNMIESLKNIVEDQIKNFDLTVEGMRTKGVVEDIINAFREKRDRTFEVAARNIIGKAVWTEIKQNAERAALGKGVLRLVSFQIKELLKKHPSLNMHFVGHSAGSIWLGHLADDLRQAKLTKISPDPVKTVTLWAPACTTAFATRYFGKALENGLISKGGLHIDLLSQENEMSDFVYSESMYGKSLLYLISRALEDIHKTPLLGLEMAWPKYFELAKQKDLFAKSLLPDISKWQRVVEDYGVTLVSVTKPRANTGTTKILSNHGSFDNDIDINMEMMRRILGVPPTTPIEKLLPE